MTLPQNVKDADEEMVAAGGEIIWRHYPAIRAHLLSQDAEIDRLRGRAVPLTEWQRMESRLAAADALLRDIAGCQWFNREAPATVELIDAHLQGAGDEA